MVTVLNPNEADGLRMSILDTNIAYGGAYRTQDDACVGGMREGHLHLADSGMQVSGSRTPKTGYRVNCTVIGEDLGSTFPGIDTHVQGGAGPKQWVAALKRRGEALEKQCPIVFPELVKEPLYGICLVNVNIRVKWKMRLGPADQLNWDMVYALKPDLNCLRFGYVPRPPGNRTLRTEMPRGRFPTIHNTYTATPPPAIARGSGTHEPVLVTPQAGSVMAPTHGFDPSIASNQQSFDLARIVDGERALRLGAGSVSSEETADGPKPRVPLPRSLSHYAKEGGAPLREPHFADRHGDLAMHHPLTSCIVWMVEVE